MEHSRLSFTTEVINVLLKLACKYMSHPLVLLEQNYRFPQLSLEWILYQANDVCICNPIYVLLLQLHITHLNGKQSKMCMLLNFFEVDILGHTVAVKCHVCYDNGLLTQAILRAYLTSPCTVYMDNASLICVVKKLHIGVCRNHLRINFTGFDNQ